MFPFPLTVSKSFPLEKHLSLPYILCCKFDISKNTQFLGYKQEKVGKAIIFI